MVFYILVALSLVTLWYVISFSFYNIGKLSKKATKHFRNKDIEKSGEIREEQNNEKL